MLRQPTSCAGKVLAAHVDCPSAVEVLTSSPRGLSVGHARHLTATGRQSFLRCGLQKLWSVTLQIIAFMQRGDIDCKQLKCFVTATKRKELLLEDEASKGTIRRANLLSGRSEQTVLP